MVRKRDPEKWTPVFRKDHAQTVETGMPKLKREGEERATDFVESLDRGLRLLQAFGTITVPPTCRAPRRAASCSHWRMAASSRPTESCFR
jgi:hypothetical protein